MNRGRAAPTADAEDAAAEEHRLTSTDHRSRSSCEGFRFVFECLIKRGFDLWTSSGILPIGWQGGLHLLNEQRQIWAFQRVRERRFLMLQIIGHMSGFLSVAVFVVFNFVNFGFAATTKFQGLGNLGDPSFPRSWAYAVSADGKVVVGASSSEIGKSHIEAFRWTEQNGMVGLGYLPVQMLRGDSRAYGTSKDGKIIVGASLKWIARQSQDIRRGILWEKNELTDLGTLGDSDVPSSEALGISEDGSVIVGAVLRITSNPPGGPHPEAIMWKNKTPTGLGQLPGGFASKAYAVSANGYVVVGRAETNKGVEAFRWENNVMSGLGDLPGGVFESEARGLSCDGKVIVGYSRSQNGGEAFRWESGQMVPLGDLPGGQFWSVAHGVSADGKFVVGHGNTASGVEAFIWDSWRGMRNLKDVLINDYSLGATLSGWVLESAQAITTVAGSLIVVGIGTNPKGEKEAWITEFDTPTDPIITQSIK